VSRIAGIVGSRGGEPAERSLEAMLRASLAGGPGGELHTRSADRAELGWAGGGTPQLAERADALCVLDGRIYNAAELGDYESDAALVAALAREHGFVGALGRLNGDFAIAHWDGRSGELWLGRDRFGVRPLYHLRDAEGFAFASRPRSLLALPGVEKAVEPRFLGLFAGSHYRTFDNDRAASPYRDVAQLPAAHALRISDGGLELREYWTLHDAPDLDDPREALAGRYRELLLDAVGIRLRRASAPAFTLSGGMDSSSVLASSVHLTGRRQQAFSTVYAGSEYDESEEIASMLDSAVEAWNPVRVDDPDVFGLVERMIDTHDEPVATATWLSHFVLCEEVAGRGFDTIFGGLGGDELNAGEYEYFPYRFADLRVAGEEERLDREVEAWVRHHDHPIFRKDRAVMEAALARLVDLDQPGRILPDRPRIERYRHAIEPGLIDLAGYEPVMDTPFSSYLKNRTWQDLYRETAPCCLRAEDRQTFAYGLRNCDPFFDHRLAELMFRVGGDQKIRDGITKRLLRDAMRGVLPEETRTRTKKTGWNAPADAWFSGAGRERLLDLVGSERFRGRGIYRVGEVRRLIDEHDQIVSSGRAAENHMMFLWQLVNLELWLRWVDDL